MRTPYPNDPLSRALIEINRAESLTRLVRIPLRKRGEQRPTCDDRQAIAAARSERFLYLVAREHVS